MFVAIVNNSMDSNYSTRYILFCQTNHRFAYFIHLKQTNQSIDGSCFCCFIYWVAYLLPSRVGVGILYNRWVMCWYGYICLFIDDVGSLLINWWVASTLSIKYTHIVSHGY